MQSEPVNLEQTEEWDDYAIQSSWNAAVAEYEKYHSIAQSGKPLEEVLTKEELQAILEAGKQKASRPFRVGDETNGFPPLDPATNRRSEAEEGDEGEVEDGEYVVGEDEEVEYDATAGGEDGEFGEFQDTRSFQTHKHAGNVNERDIHGHESAASSAAHQASPTQGEVVENAMQAQYWAGYYRGYYDAMKKLNGVNNG